MMVDSGLKTLMQQCGDEPLLRDYCARIHRDYDETYLNALQAQRYADLPYQLPNKDEYNKLAIGDFRLGRIGRYGETLQLDLKDALPLGLSIVGGTGMGKTTLLSNIAHHLGKYDDVGCWLFNVRDEINTKLPNFQNVRMSEILPNLFERKGYLKPEVQANKVADIIASTFYLLWTRSLIAKVLIPFYTKNQSPTLFEVGKKIKEQKAGKSSGLTSQQLNKLIGVFDYLLQTFGREKHLVKGFQSHQHWDKKLVILNDVGKQDVQALLISYLLWSLYEYNLHHNHRNKLRTAFLVDESKYLLSLEREKIAADFGATVLDDLITLQRSAGLALVAATQLAFPKTYATNTATKILLKTGDVRFYQLSAQSMGLNKAQMEFALLNCKVGDAVITSTNFNRPLLVALDNLQFTPQADSCPTRMKKDYEYSHQKASTRKVQEMLPGAGALLRFYAQNRLVPYTQAIKALGLNRDAAGKIVTHLIDHHFIKKAQVKLYCGRGRQPVLIELTEKGRDWIKVNHPELEIKTLRGKGSLEHRAHQHLVKEHYRQQGYLVELETHDADLVVKKADVQEWFAIEIVNMHSRNVQQRIEANQKAGAQTTLIICSDTKSFQKAKTFPFFNQVEIEPIDPYLLER